jgi:serine/threonine protein phosphatase PrpC
LLAVQGSPVAEANQPYHHNSNPASDNPGNSNSHPDPQPSDDEDAGTTASVLMITPQWVICANAGDSRAVFSKNGNKAVPLSYDHKPDDESEETRIREAGGYVAGGRVEGDLAVSRGWGDYRFKDIGTVLLGSPHTRHVVKQMKKGKQQTIEPMMEPDDQKVSPVPDIIVQNRNKESDEFVVIACDGIYDVMTNHDCVKTVADMFAEGETNIGLICEELLDICLQLGSKDNMSAIVVKFDAQEIGEGGGVQHRRKLRQEAEEKNDNGKRGGASKVRGNGGDVKMDEDEVEHDS